jgi:hypothetical protein
MPLLLLLLLLLQAVVFGVSCYFDVQDMMEKRVRSRFSNRKVFLNGLCAAQQVRHAELRTYKTCRMLDISQRCAFALALFSPA